MKNVTPKKPEPPPATPPTPEPQRQEIPAPTPAPEPSAEAKPTTAAEIVAGDTATFPKSDVAPNNGPTPPAGEAPPDPAHPDKPPGYKGTGRPKGSRTRNRGRFAKATPPRETPGPGPGSSTIPPDLDGEPQVMVDYEELARTVVMMTTELAANTIGPEWRPGVLQGPQGQTIPEELMIVRPLAKYLESKEVPDIPPGLLVLLALGLYSSRRFQVPNTRDKIGGFFKWAKDKVVGLFRRKKKSPGAVVAQPQGDKPEANG